MKVSCGVSASMIASVFVLAIVLIFIVSGHFNSVIVSFNASKSEFTVPELQTKVNSDEVRAVMLSDRSTANGSSVNRRFRNRTVVRKKVGLLEQGLALSRAAIRKAASNQNGSSNVHGSDLLSGNIYRNPGAFYRSYVEMERRLKVYVYEEGEVPIVHDGPCKNIYSTEGRFIHEMEHGNSRFRTMDADRAHVYFMPFSVAWMVKYLYQPLSYNQSPLRDFVADYVRVVSTKHPFWNRTHGADHFMLSCHDWGPHASRGNPHLYNTSIRVLCNANSSEGFIPQKDVSLPEIVLYGGAISPKLVLPPPPTSPRPLLAFFSGGLHGPIRPALLRHWKLRDPDLQVYEYLPKHLDYYSLMLQSKFCLCPSGHEVASPRIVEAVYAECVPVILSENYILPFSDVLKWDAFSLQVQVSEIPRLKEVLMGVPEEEYLRLKEGVRAVRRHFEWNQPAKRFDVFHMILHSVWLRRLNLRLG
ncbi:probable glycosyltransferase At5g25310 [Actinidia eriantha]|uniref:probable glycosyltransferase At5g25310 n=1 Tax=Actinidia eriantha TaxID=165200 RepID=UPI002583F20A|nr:probable glycosyltransferase At5g25310 [Actinidia eriantha]